MKLRLFLGLALAGLALGAPARGATIFLDESKLSFTLPFTGTQGDLVIYYPGFHSPNPADPSAVSDVLRFNGNGTVTIFSDPADTGPPAPADANGLPASIQTNAVFVFKTIQGGLEFVNYTPTVGQPGYNAAAPPTYSFIDAIPEPASVVLSGTAALVGLGAFALRRRKRTAA